MQGQTRKQLGHVGYQVCLSETWWKEVKKGKEDTRKDQTINGRKSERALALVGVASQIAYDNL
jgi:hypothetical protein